MYNIHSLLLTPKIAPESNIIPKMWENKQTDTATANQSNKLLSTQ